MESIAEIRLPGRLSRLRSQARLLALRPLEKKNSKLSKVYFTITVIAD